MSRYEWAHVRALKLIVAATVVVMAFFMFGLDTAHAQDDEVLEEVDTDYIQDETLDAVQEETLELVKYTDAHYWFESDLGTVSVMVDDLRQTPHTAYNNSVYSGRFLESSDYTASYDYDLKWASGLPVHIYKFERQPLLHAPELDRHFLYLEIELEPQILLNIHIKSSEPIDESMILSALSEQAISEYLTDVQSMTADLAARMNGDSGNTEALAYSVRKADVFERSPRVMLHEGTADLYQNMFIDSKEVAWGIFDPSTHYELTEVEAIEDETGIEFDILLEYYDLGYLPRVEKMQEITDSGRTLELTYQTSLYGTFNADMLYEVLNGEHDDMIGALIQRIKALDEPVLFRPNNEMNGDWCSYNAMYTHKDAEVFRVFWQWLYERFEAAGCDNVIWVWNPNWGDFPAAQWNHYLMYFPGPEYVDVVGLTGYNTGTYYDAETWRSFLDIYLPMIWEYRRHFIDFPFMITEFGSSNTGGDKAAWIHAALTQIEKLGIRAAVWWNYVDYDTRAGTVSRGYRFDDDPDVLDIFRQRFQRNMDDPSLDDESRDSESKEE